MTRFFLALIRLVALALSFILSTFAAAGFITFVLFLGADANWLQEDPFVAIGAATFLMAMWLNVAQLSFYPALGIFFVLEFARYSSLLTNLLAGGLCAIATLLLLPEFTQTEVLPYPNKEVWLAVIASGFIAGLTHWLLAGNRSGRWLGPQKNKAA